MGWAEPSFKPYAYNWERKISSYTPVVLFLCWTLISTKKIVAYFPCSTTLSTPKSKKRWPSSFIKWKRSDLIKNACKLTPGNGKNCLIFIKAKEIKMNAIHS